jgi:hypothetical protein
MPDLFISKLRPARRSGTMLSQCLGLNCRRLTGLSHLKYFRKELLRSRACTLSSNPVGERHRLHAPPFLIHLSAIHQEPRHVVPDLQVETLSGVGGHSIASLSEMTMIFSKVYEHMMSRTSRKLTLNSWRASSSTLLNCSTWSLLSSCRAYRLINPWPCSCFMKAIMSRKILQQNHISKLVSGIEKNSKIRTVRSG